MWRLFVVVAFVMIVAASTAFASEAGWIPWSFGLALVVLALVLGGVRARRRRGTRSPIALREPRTKLHTRDLETHPPPKPGEP